MVRHRGLEPRTFRLRVCYSGPIELVADICCLMMSLYQQLGIYRSFSLSHLVDVTGTSRLPTAFLSIISQGEEYSLQIEDILHLHILGTMSRRRVHLTPTLIGSVGHDNEIRTRISTLKGWCPQPIRRCRVYYSFIFSIYIIS